MDIATKVNFTNLDKVLYPDVGLTKGQVVEYYVRMAPKMLDILKNRPVVLTRFPDGVDKEGFYEKDMPRGTPSWVKSFKRYSETAKRELNYIICNDLDTLVWLANLAALELHISLARMDRFDNPDLLVFDVDPEPPASFDDAVKVVLLLKEKLDLLHIKAYIKTSGKKGLHVLVPIVREYSYAQTRGYVHQIGRFLARECPVIVSEFSESKKPGTVYIDYSQNSHGKTMVCPYSLRATPNATVSFPISWSDFTKGLKPENYTLSTVAKSRDTPWKGMLDQAQKLEGNIN